MKQWVIAGTLAGALALGGGAFAQEPSASKPTAEQAGKPAAKPRPKAKSTENQSEGHTAPKQQPNTAPDADVTVAATTLGTVRLPKAVTADGKPLAPGTYQVRLTTDEAKPDAVGTSGKTERWVEFVQGGQVKGREIATIVPQSEMTLVQKDAAPAPGANKVQILKGNDYVRVWLNKGGTHYLIHLVSKA
jgi:hypothetical protein